MKPGEERIPVLNVTRAMDNRWQVASDPADESVPVFDTPQEACAWAIARAKLRRGRVLVENTPVDMGKENGGYLQTPWQKAQTRFNSNPR